MFSGVLRAAGILLFLSGLVAFGQYPGNAETSPAFDEDITPVPWSGQLSPLTPHQADQEPIGAPVVPTEREEAAGTVAATELKHPLSRKGQSLISRAQAAFEDRNMEKCYRELDKAMKVRSAVPYAHSLRGAAYLLQGRVPEAVSELQQAVQLLPVSINYSNLGYAHILSGETEQGEEEVRRAVRLQDSSPQAQLLMGLLLLNRKPQIAEACQHLEKARGLDRAVSMALAVCYARDGREDAATRQIRAFLGPADESKFEFWRRWTANVAVQRMPSAAFGLRMAPKP